MVRPDGVPDGWFARTGAHASAMSTTSLHRALGTTSHRLLAPTPGQANVGSLRILCFIRVRSLLSAFTGQASPHTSTLSSQIQAKRCGSAARRPPCPRVRRPHGALRAALTVHVVRDLTQVRAVRALDGGGGSRSADKLSLGKKAQAAAAAKLSMRSPRVTRSTASTDPDGACCKPAVGARPRPAQSLHTGALTPPMVAARLMSWRLLHSLAPSLGTSLQSVGPPLPSRSPSPALRSQGSSRRRPRVS